MPASHTDGMLRICGATTVVSGQSTVYVNGLLQSVAGDPNNHGDGALIPSVSTVFVCGILPIVNAPDHATMDLLIFPPHDDPFTNQGSSDVFIEGGG